MKTLKKVLMHLYSKGSMHNPNPQLQTVPTKLIVAYKATLPTHLNQSLLEDLYSDLIQIDADLDGFLESSQLNR